MWHPTLKWRSNLAGPSFHKLFYFSSNCESLFFLRCPLFLFILPFLLLKDIFEAAVKGTDNKQPMTMLMVPLRNNFFPRLFYLFCICSTMKSFLGFQAKRIILVKIVRSKHEPTLKRKHPFLPTIHHSNVLDYKDLRIQEAHNKQSQFPFITFHFFRFIKGSFHVRWLDEELKLKNCQLDNEIASLLSVGTKVFSAPLSFVFKLPPNENPFISRKNSVHSRISKAHKRFFSASDFLRSSRDGHHMKKYKQFIGGTRMRTKRGLFFLFGKYLNNEIQWHTTFPSLYSCSHSRLMRKPMVRIIRTQPVRLSFWLSFTVIIVKHQTHVKSTSSVHRNLNENRNLNIVDNNWTSGRPHDITETLGDSKSIRFSIGMGSLMF